MEKKKLFLIVNAKQSSFLNNIKSSLGFSNLFSQRKA